MNAEQLLDDGTETNPWKPSEAGGELGVKEPRRRKADLAKACEVLARRVKNPLFSSDCVVKLGELADRWGIEEECAGAASENLDEISALRVAVTRCSFGINGDRTRAGGDGLYGSKVPFTRVDDVDRRVYCLNGRVLGNRRR
jgi:hypothetical protein